MVLPSHIIAFHPITRQMLPVAHLNVYTGW